ncbi:hypothetical protein GGR57DRAFT_176445 [Xylariaceae sp. FL1272]|nr:hypothetical protein GGR57DRAFT_176445 [Xylariaceae sp. FL1272]
MKFMHEWPSVELAVNEEHVNADIDLFVPNALLNDDKIRRFNEEVKREIQHVLHTRSDGMFRWAALQLEFIRCLKIHRPKYILATLKNMPKNLYETYERMLCVIDELNVDDVRTALEWLVVSERPLTLAEFTEACSIRVSHENDPYIEEIREDVIYGLLNVLGSFILVEDIPASSYHKQDWDLPSYTSCRGREYVSWEALPKKSSSECYSRKVRLAHFTGREYLVSSRIRTSSASGYAMGDDIHLVLAQSCCAYLVYFTKRKEITRWIEEEEEGPQTRNEPSIIQSFLEDFMHSYPCYHILPADG